MDEKLLKMMFERSQQENPDKMGFTEEESSKFKKAFEDPEFRKLFADYVDELQDPQNREETEAYISQLEGEQKVPAGRELIRPEPAFVAKTHKVIDGSDPNKEKEKVFLNIVQSIKIEKPSKTSTPKGDCWSVPYSLGPPHMEKDKTGNNAPCFDCCFHPEALSHGSRSKEFKNLLVTTAMEGVEQSYKNQGYSISLDRDFRVVKGVKYKQGAVPTMMIATANKETWKAKESTSSAPSTATAPAQSTVKQGSQSAGSNSSAVPTASPASSSSSPQRTARTAGTSAGSGEGSDTSLARDQLAKELVGSSNSGAEGAKAKKATKTPAIKKGFLSGSKKGIYDDKLDTVRPRNREQSQQQGATANIALAESERPSTGDINFPSVSTTTAKSKRTPALIKEIKAGEEESGHQASGGSRPHPEASATGPSMPSGMKEVSSSARRKTDPPTKAPTNAAATATAATSACSTAAEDAGVGGVETPRFSVKERGHVSMGGFERLTSPSQAAAASSRPSELVYRIELPRVAKASQIALDIAERQLKLTYQDVYKLDVRLPYPVVDTRTAAKYDKSARALTVTLAVQPPASAECALPAPPYPAAGTEGSGVREVEREEQGPPSAPSAASPTKRATPAPAPPTKGLGHSRWVDSEKEAGKTVTAAVTRDGPEADAASQPSGIDGAAGTGSAAAGAGSGSGGQTKPLSLYEEIQQKAAQALLEAQQAQQAQQAAKKDSAVSSASAPVVRCSLSRSAASVEVPQAAALTAADFEAVAAFSGRREGYVFKRGDLGVGYYRDAKGEHTAPKHASSHISTDGGSSTTDEKFRFQARQTKQSLALLVEVPGIERTSVQVLFRPLSVDISFEAAVCAGSGDRAGARTVRYSMGLDLPAELCVGGLDPAQCKYDVAAQNMALVLTKKQPRYWLPPSFPVGDKDQHGNEVRDGRYEDHLQAMEESKAGTDANPMSLTGDEHTQKLFSVRPFRGTGSEVGDSTCNDQSADAIKSLHSTLEVLQFSSSDAIFDLD